MNLVVDYLIVGSGLTGATIARLLADAGREVLVVERRPHVGGNVHDHFHPSGIRIHSYGPHYFRTSSDRIWHFVNRFSSFYDYEAIVKSYVDGAYENWPIAADYIQRTLGESWKVSFEGTPRNFEEASLAMMPQPIYEKFVKGYTEKQWGVPASDLAADLAGRFEVRRDNDPRLKKSKYQGIPSEGYHEFMSNMLDGIPIILNFDYLIRRGEIKFRKNAIFTGPIDEFFGFDLGHLTYRSQKREHEYFPDVDYALPCGQVNNPNSNSPHIRTLEWKHMMPQDYARRISGTVLTREIPFSPKDPDSYEYPFPSASNFSLYERYRKRAADMPGFVLCGRLGEYRYYDMDEAIANAMDLAKRIIGSD